jgi:hypothetical protein
MATDLRANHLMSGDEGELGDAPVIILHVHVCVAHTIVRHLHMHSIGSCGVALILCRFHLLCAWPWSCACTNAN